MALRAWIEERYKRIKHELGWAEFMVRADHAIHRHWMLVWCAFSFCWSHEAQQAAVPPQQAVSHAPKPVRGKIKLSRRPVLDCWPQALRRARSWLAPWKWLNTCWHAWHDKPPSPELVELLDAVTVGLGIDLYLRE